MARRRAAEKREILPDPKFKDQVVTRLMNAIMLDGKKSAAERIVYGAFDKMESRMSRDPLEVFREALENVKPSLEVRLASRRWCHLSGAGRGAPSPSPDPGDSLDHRHRAQAFRKDHGGPPRR